MKVLFIALLFSMPALAQQDIRDLSIQTAYGGELTLDHYTGQKMVFACISVEMLQKKGVVEYWDSLKTAYPQIAFFLIPASDIDTLTNDSVALENIKAKGAKKVMLADARKVKKYNGATQDPVMQWLTDVNKNQHNDLDVYSDMQLFVVSESGVLYSILTKDTPPKFLKAVLEQADEKPSPYGELKP